MARETLAAGTNSIRKGITAGSANQAAGPTLERSTIPKQSAVRYPTIMPNSRAPNLQMPLVKWLRNTTTPKVIRATLQLRSPPNQGLSALPPAI